MREPKRPLEPETFLSGGAVAQACSQGYPRRPALSNPLGLPGPLTTKQLLYLWFPQAIGAACLDAGINFGIAYAMYHTAASVTMWDISQNTIAGDLGITTLIQGTLTFVIAGSLVRVDMRKGAIDAFPYPWPDTRFGVVVLKEGPESARTERGKMWRRFHQTHGLGRGLHFFSGSATNDLFDRRLTRKDFFPRLTTSVWKGFIMSCLYFAVLWPIAILCLAPYYSSRNMAHSYAPQIIKLVYAFILGFLQNPIVAMIALGSEDAVRDHRREVQDQAIVDLEGRSPMPNTWAESLVRPEPVHGKG